MLICHCKIAGLILSITRIKINEADDYNLFWNLDPTYSSCSSETGVKLVKRHSSSVTDVSVNQARKMSLNLGLLESSIAILIDHLEGFLVLLFRWLLTKDIGESVVQEFERLIFFEVSTSINIIFGPDLLDLCLAHCLLFGIY